MKARYTILLGLIVGSLLALLATGYQYKPSYKQVSYADAVSRAAPAVVNIYTRKSNQVATPNYRYPHSNRAPRVSGPAQINLGSGVIVLANGFIVTNYHVIQDAEEILIMLYDGREALAQIVGIDKETDLAVLKIDLSNLTAAKPGNLDKLRVGDPAIAIGNPFGFGQSVSAGIISATGRYGLNLNTYEDFIQTDAAINIGSSGGALLNYKGELIGINAAIYSQSGGSQGIGLAIPVDIVIKVTKDLIRFGQVIRGWLGLEVTQLTSSIAARLDIRQTSGVIITNIYRNSPAHIAGLLPGDVIININGKHIDSGQEGMLEVANLSPGASVVIEIIRDNRSMIIPIIVGIRPATE